MRHVVISAHVVNMDIRGNCLRITTPGQEARLFPRAGLELESLVIDAARGHVSVEAMAWLEKAGVSWHHLSRNSGQIASGAPVPHADAVNAQLHYRLSGQAGVTRMIMGELLGGRAQIAEEMGAARVVKAIRARADQAAVEDSLLVMRGLEGKAASAYWRAWAARQWPCRDFPAHWQGFTRRKSLATTSVNRNATDPVNACLNYAYGIGEMVAERACHATGLSPLIGFSHRLAYRADRDGVIPKATMALDILEALRPGCERAVLAAFDRVPGLRRADFVEVTHAWQGPKLPEGTIRLKSPELRKYFIEMVESQQDYAIDLALKVRKLIKVTRVRKGRGTVTEI